MAEWAVFVAIGIIAFNLTHLYLGPTLEACSTWCWTAGVYGIWFVIRRRVLELELVIGKGSTSEDGETKQVKMLDISPIGVAGEDEVDPLDVNIDLKPLRMVTIQDMKDNENDRFDRKSRLTSDYLAGLDDFSLDPHDLRMGMRSTTATSCS